MIKNHVNIAIRQNYLLVGGEMLRMENTSPDELTQILKLGNVTIRRGIMEFYEKTLAANPDAHVVHPSINVMNLGRDMKRSPVLTQIGRDKGTGLYSDEFQVAGRIRPYWRAIAHAAFIPEVRLWNNSTFGLLLRDEPL